MNRNLGLSAGMLALLALFVHMSPIGQDQSGGKSDTQSTERRVPQSDTDNIKEIADTPEGPWFATWAIFGKPEREPQLRRPDTPQNPPAPPDFGIPASIDISQAIATVPDPWHTRLALFTDGTMDAIESAASVDWNFAAQWLPWADPIDPQIKDPVRRRYQRARASAQENEPGVLVFRHSLTGGNFDRRVLLIFIVGETPTGGVNQMQFRKAKEYVRALGGDGSVFMLGPSFSGSFQSLRELVAEDAQTRFVVRNGNAASVPDARAFRKLKNVVFTSANTSSEDFQYFFLEALAQLGIEPNRAAVLAEDETRIGSVAEPKTSTETPGQACIDTVNIRDVLKLKFPRDISQLRNAYRDTSNAAGDKRLPSDVQFSLKDSELGEDSIPSFSGAQGPLSQDSRLEEDLDLIRRNQIRAVEIIATNALDALFLARVLQQKSPDTRIVVPYANLLFVEAARTEGLRNVLSISGYPLLSERSWWRPNQATPLLTYSDSLSEGVYNATTLLLDDIAGREDSARGTNLDDYWWEGQWHPPVWLLTLDREGFLPVRAWTHSDEKCDDWWEKIHPPAQTPAQSWHLTMRPSLIWYLGLGVISVVGLGTMGWSALLWSADDPRMDGRFLPVLIRGDAWRLFYLCHLLLLLAAMEIVFCEPWLRLRPVPSAWLGLALAALLTVIVMAILATWFFDSRRTPRQRIAGWTMLASLIPYAAGFAVWNWAIFSQHDGDGLFFSLRAAELRFGSSPALPLLSCLVALIMYCYVHLHRVYLAVCHQPSFITGLQSVLQRRLETAGDSLSRHARSAFGLVETSEWASVAAGLLVAAALGFRFDWRSLSSVDGATFNAVLIVLQSALAAALLLSCVQMSRMWQDLKSFLTVLGTLPLASFFIARDRKQSNRPIWVQNLNLQSLSTLVRGPFVLHDIALMKQEEIGPLYQNYREQVRALVAGEAPSRAEQLTRYAAADKFSVTISERLFDKYVSPHWQNLPLVGKLETGTQEYREERDPTGQLGIPGDPDKIADLAQAFLALHITPFLLYSVKQIRGIIWFLSLGFVGLAIAMNADAPQSPQVISRFLLLLFVVIAAVLWRCLSGIERDPIISRIEGTKPGQLNFEFYFKLAGYVALPVAGLLAAEFPSIANFLFSWIEPTLTAVK